MGSKSRSKRPKSNIDQAQLDLMRQQQARADEAMRLEREAITKQTADQQKALTDMVAVYKAQNDDLIKSRAEQQRYLDELSAANLAQEQQATASAQRAEAAAETEGRTLRRKAQRLTPTPPLSSPAYARAPSLFSQ